MLPTPRYGNVFARSGGDDQMMPAAPLGPTHTHSPSPAGHAGVRDILVRMVGAEAYWIQHVIPTETRVRVKPKTFENR